MNTEIFSRFLPERFASLGKPVLLTDMEDRQIYRLGENGRYTVKLISYETHPEDFLSGIDECLTRTSFKELPGMIQLFDYDIQPDRLLIYQLENYAVPLSSRLQAVDMTDPEILQMGIDLCQASEYCLKHDIPLMHIHPGDIFFSWDMPWRALLGNVGAGSQEPSLPEEEAVQAIADTMASMIKDPSPELKECFANPIPKEPSLDQKNESAVFKESGDISALRWFSCRLQELMDNALDNLTSEFRPPSPQPYEKTISDWQRKKEMNHELY